MNYEPNSLVKWAWNHAPRCLSGFIVRPLLDVPDGNNDYGHFALSCECDSSNWYVLAHQPEPELSLCPVSLRCEKCALTVEVFDIEKHGYDAEMGHECYSRRAEGDQVVLCCPECNAEVFEVAAVFGYQIEEAELEKDELSNAHNLFDDFSLSLSCKSCARETIECGYECA